MYVIPRARLTDRQFWQSYPSLEISARGYGDDFFFSSRRRHTRSLCAWSSDVCSSDLTTRMPAASAASTPAGVEAALAAGMRVVRSEEHTSELQAHSDLVCRLLLEK